MAATNTLYIWEEVFFSDYTKLLFLNVREAFFLFFPLFPLFPLFFTICLNSPEVTLSRYNGDTYAKME
jgi:hypothetical protein